MNLAGVIAPSTATTRLDHIHANLGLVRARVGNRKVLAAVKANAYGHGAVEVARMIEATQAADWLGVSTVEEGVELREAGVRMPILKLNVARGDDVRAAIAADLTLIVVDEESITAAGRVAAELDRRVEVQLKVDTGMHRLGCAPRDAPRLAALATITPRMRVGGVMSHLPSADVPAQNDYTVAQIARFARVCAEIEAITGPVVKHLANSAGIIAYPDSWFDMVRPGIMVYGAYPSPQIARIGRLLPGLEWTTWLASLTHIEAGESVGYGRTWTAPHDTWIGTFPVGYADGYSRALSNRGRVFVGGQAYPIAGRVCMDQTMVDLGPRTDAKVGDEVTLIGRRGTSEITTTELADIMGTIPHEVMCLIGDRVQRAVVPA